MIFFNTKENSYVELRIILAAASFWRKMKICFSRGFSVSYEIKDRAQVIDLRDTLTEWIDRGQPKRGKKLSNKDGGQKSV